MNQIVRNQSEESELCKLAAQRILYSRAKVVQSIQIILSVPSVIVISLVVLKNPNISIIAAVWGISVSFLDVVIFSNWEQYLKRTAATIQESFDCKVLQLEWNSIKIGQSKPDPETIHTLCAKYKKNDPNLSKLKDWYPTIINKLPLHLARLVCQRSNCWWDVSLRKSYSVCILTLLTFLTFFVFGLSLLGDLTLRNFFLTVAAPLLPAFILFSRQYKEHRNSINVLNTLKQHAENIWDLALRNCSNEIQCTKISRLLQDEIYNHRCTSPLIFDFIYNKLKSDYEIRMNIGAEELTKEAINALSLQ